MAAGRYDIEIEQGSDYELAVLYQDPDGEIINMTDFTLARMQIRENTDSTPILELRSDSPANAESYVISQAITLFGNNDPNIRIAIGNGATAQLDFDTAFYDLELVGTNGSVTKIIRGLVKLIKEYTK